MYDCGDVVAYYSPSAGKQKYHLCFGDGPNDLVLLFLHINSKSGYNGDCVFDDGEIDNLPISDTTLTVVSFSQVIRLPKVRLAAQNPTTVAAISQDVAEKLYAFAKETKVLSPKDRTLLLDALRSKYGFVDF